MKKHIQIYIDFNLYDSHVDLIRQISSCFEAKCGDEVFLKINLNTSSLLYSDHLLLVVALVKHLRQKNVKVKGEFVNFKKDSNRTRYASRINFFEQLGITLEEDFQRQNNTGRFIEISEFNNDSINAIQEAINKIFYDNVQVNKQMLEMFYYCLNEIMDNVLNHSAESAGFVTAQLFPGNQVIRLIICDTGIGIYESLQSNPDLGINHFTEKEALKLCIRKGISNGKGLGFGLFATSEFVKQNKGELLIYSGSSYLSCKEKGIELRSGSFWQGTIVFLKINTGIPVDYKSIFGKDYPLQDDYYEYIKRIFGIDDDLW